MWIKRRVTLGLSPIEANYLLGALDIWIEGYTDTVDDADDHDSVVSLMEDLDVGLVIRDRLFRRMTKV